MSVTGSEYQSIENFYGPKQIIFDSFKYNKLINIIIK